MSQDIYIVAVPATSGRYDPEIQKRLIRAAKKKVLEDLEAEGLLGPGSLHCLSKLMGRSKNFTDDTFAAFLHQIIKNLLLTAVILTHTDYAHREKNSNLNFRKLGEGLTNIFEVKFLLFFSIIFFFYFSYICVRVVTH